MSTQFRDVPSRRISHDFVMENESVKLLSADERVITEQADILMTSFEKLIKTISGELHIKPTSTPTIDYGVLKELPVDMSHLIMENLDNVMDIIRMEWTMNPNYYMYYKQHGSLRDFELHNQPVIKLSYPSPTDKMIDCYYKMLMMVPSQYHHKLRITFDAVLPEKVIKLLGNLCKNVGGLYLPSLPIDSINLSNVRYKKPIYDLLCMDNFVNLRYLYAVKYHIRNINLCKTLQVLIIHECNIIGFNISDLPNLHTLEFEGSEFPILDNVDNLRNLTIRYNNQEVLPLQKLPNLEKLHIEFCEMNTLYTLPKIQELNLISCDIISVKKQVTLKKLKILHSMVTINIPELDLTTLTQLEDLTLSNNIISRVKYPECTFSFHVEEFNTHLVNGLGMIEDIFDDEY
jgi:hypothetical protein